MKTKTLLIAAATLAVGVISSQAQVYSQNIVGYVNVPYPASAFKMTANQLLTGTDTAKTNCNIQAVLGTNGWFSDGGAVNNTAVYIWDLSSHTWQNRQFFNAADANNNFGADFGDGWYNSDGSLATDTIAPNQAVFIKDYSGANRTNTMVGTVVTGTNVFAINQGFTTFCLTQPISTNPVVNFKGTSDGGGINNTAYYHWNNGTWDILQYFTVADAENNFGSDNGDNWYLSDATTIDGHPEMWPKVGEGFFIHQPLATTVYYTNTFIIQ